MIARGGGKRCNGHQNCKPTLSYFSDVNQANGASCTGQSFDTPFLCLGSVLWASPSDFKFCGLNTRWISREEKNLVTVAIVNLPSEASNSSSTVRECQKERVHGDGQKRNQHLWHAYCGPRYCVCSFLYIFLFYPNLPWLSKIGI